MANFIGLVYATLKNEGVDTSGMSTDEAVAKFKELQKKSGGDTGKEGTPAEQRKLKEKGVVGNKTNNENNELEELKKEYIRRYTTYTDNEGNVWTKEDVPTKEFEGETLIAMRDDRGVQWFPEKEVNEMKVNHAKLENEGIDTKDMSTDEAVKKYNELQKRLAERLERKKAHLLSKRD